MHISNAHILRVAKLVDGIKLNIQEKYNLAEVLIGSYNFNDSKDEEVVTNKETMAIIVAC